MLTRFKPSRSKQHFMAFFAAFVLCFSPWFPAVEKGTVAAETRVYQDLIQKAKADGSIPVIVHLAVPKINALFERSNAYSNVHPGIKFPADALEADRDLAEAVGGVTRSVLSKLEGMDFRPIRTFRVFPFLALQVSPAAMEKLSTLEGVISIQEDVPTPLVDDLSGKSPLTELFMSVDPPTLGDSVSLIGADAAWNLGYTGAGWYVAILDTGIRRTHEFFQHRFSQ